MEETPKVEEDLGGGGKFKNWMQDNIRIILSVLIVIAIAAGIYSYSKRTETPAEDQVAVQEVEVVEEQESVTIIGEEQKEEAKEEVKEEAEEEIQQKAEIDTEQVKEDIKETTEQIREKVEEVRTPEVGESQVASSQETGDAFVETAGAGDSYTTLSRRALANFLEKNNDPELTAEHKIYIEDYLRRQVQHQGPLDPSDQVSFSKVMIKDAIEKSKTLTPAQLENLKKYSARVPGI